MEQDFPGFARDLGSFALIVNDNNFRKISGCSSKIFIVSTSNKKIGAIGTGFTIYFIGLYRSPSIFQLLQKLNTLITEARW